MDLDVMIDGLFFSDLRVIIIERGHVRYLAEASIDD